MASEAVERGKMKDYKYAIFIGRFQPLHNGHIDVIKQGLSIAEKVIILVGSTNSAPTTKNPFTFEQRKTMIMDTIDPVTKTVLEIGPDHTQTITNITDAHDRIIVLSVRDYHYSYNSWLADVQSKTDQYIEHGDSVALLGGYKDASSYYLKSFPQWDFVTIKSHMTLNSTTIREGLFSVESRLDNVHGNIKQSDDLKKVVAMTGQMVSRPVLAFLTEYVKTYEFRDLVAEYNHIKDYKKKWESAPFPPTFVTADCIVTCSGHVLIVKRKFAPGVGLLALPGGFIRQNETIQNAALRELKEETGIRVDKIILESSIVNSKVFDFPDRSLRGRTITHGFHIRLKDGKLPEVRGNDDADKAFWMPLAEVFQNENKFFEDHAAAIQYFVNKE